MKDIFEWKCISLFLSIFYQTNRPVNKNGRFLWKKATYVSQEEKEEVWYYLQEIDTVLLNFFVVIFPSRYYHQIRA